MTREKGPATALKLETYAQSRRFGHVSHGDWWRSFVPHHSYVLVTGVLLSSDTLDLCLEAWYCVLCDGSRLFPFKL